MYLAIYNDVLDTEKGKFLFEINFKIRFKQEIKIRYQDNKALEGLVVVSPKEITILIVDDDEELLSSIATSFRLFQFKVVEKRSGKEAIEYLKSDDTVSLVISDIRMPDGSGMDVLEFMRARSSNHPKILFISGYSDYSVSEMYNKGVDGFFSKPFRISAIKDAITKTLLNLNERWSQPPVGHLSMMLKKTVESLKSDEPCPVRMGRGGFFVELNMQFPNEGDLVSFDFTIKDGVPISRLQGQGRVRWVRTDADGGVSRGAGVEVEYIDENCRKKFIDWLIKQNLVSFIPH